MTVQSLVSNSASRFHPETYQLTQPFSPHKSARLDNVDIKIEDFQVPATHRPLVIEGAGGLMVPLNPTLLMIDLIAHLNAEVIVVTKNYLGRSEERRVGKECVSTCRSRWAPEH